MNKTIKATVLILAVILAFVGVYFLYTNLSEKYQDNGLITQKSESSEASTDSSQKPSDKAYDPAADFSVIDADGNSVKLSDMKGTPVVLNFWATWCYYCKIEMPDFENMYKKYGNDVQFMMVDLTDGGRETVDGAKKHIADNNFTFPVFFDTGSEAAIAYNVSGIPATYFIDADGNLITYVNGMIDAESLEKWIKMIKK